MKLLDAGRGIGLTGILAGIVSSTAVTLSFSGRSKQVAEIVPALALGIILAWSIMFARVLVEVLAVNRPLLGALWAPMLAGLVAGLLYAYLLYRRQGDIRAEGIEFNNPFELMPALKFGLIYAAVLLIVRTAEIYFGTTGIYVSSLLSGTVDLHAITLSMAQLGLNGGIALDTAANAITLATLSNTVVKAGIVIFVGSKALRTAVLPAVVLISLAAGAAAWFF